MDAISAYLAYFEEVQAAIRGVTSSAARRLVDAVESIWATDGRAFLIGNGGNASVASHMMNDVDTSQSSQGSRAFGQSS